jgi:hypothetical protein
MSRWIPQKGELVGIKRLGLTGVVVESRELKLVQIFSGVRGGSATVLVEGQKHEYGWNDLYPIPPDDEDEAA